MSYVDVLCPGFNFDTGCEVEKMPGDIVKLGNNAGPDYEIVAIAGGTAWVREPVTFRNEALVPLSRIRFVNRPGLRLAA